MYNATVGCTAQLQPIILTCIQKFLQFAPRFVVKLFSVYYLLQRISFDDDDDDDDNDDYLNRSL